jgi:hypothetical protein
MTIETRHVMVQSDAFADAEFCHATADLHDGAGGFVSENSWRGDCSVMNLFDVGRANAAHRDFDEQFAGLNFRDRNGFNAQVIATAIDDGLHLPGNFDSRVFDVRVLAETNR